jgi:transposase
VLRSGIPWEMLPAEMKCGCGMSCWRRLRDWQAAGVCDKVALGPRLAPVRRVRAGGRPPFLAGTLALSTL